MALSAYLAHREPCTEFLGPGRRYAIWLQGCRKRCPGCLFPDGQPLASNGEFVSVDTLFFEIKRQEGLRGVTISGGEPFLQAEALEALVRGIKRDTRLDILVYSGYTLEELKGLADYSINFVLDNIDLLVDGEYREELNTNSIYRGSDNQNIHFLSPKYLPWKEKMLTVKNRSIEFVQKGDELFLIGVPAKNFARDFHINILEKASK